jgi:hypothetical protein
MRYYVTMIDNEMVVIGATPEYIINKKKKLFLGIW